jgi:hypothetical protein
MGGASQAGRMHSILTRSGDRAVGTALVRRCRAHLPASRAPGWAVVINGDHALTVGRVGLALGIDTFDAHWRRLQASPVTGNWYAVMQLADEQRISQIIQLATDALDPDALATGPCDSPGIGPEYAVHNALAFILQDLGRFPGQGWVALVDLLDGRAQQLMAFSHRLLRAELGRGER